MLKLFQGVDVILHAGDLLQAWVLDELDQLATTYAVLGNNDDASLAGRLPERRRLDLGGVAVGMVHDSGRAQGRRARMRRAFAGCRVVIFGHSHQPLIEDDGELLLLNPGSACDPRRARIPSVALLSIDDDDVTADLALLEARKP